MVLISPEVKGRITLAVEAQESINTPTGPAQAMHKLVWDGQEVKNMEFMAFFASYAYSEERTLAAGASDDFDLSLGIYSKIGVQWDAGDMTLIGVVNLASNPGEDLLVTPHPTTGFKDFISPATGAIVVPAGGCAFWFARYSFANGVTDGLEDILRITNNSSASITYRVVLLGM